jgi:hypothetical protein
MVFEKYVDFQKIGENIVHENEQMNVFIQYNFSSHPFYSDDGIGLLLDTYLCAHNEDSYIAWIENASKYEYVTTEETIHIDNPYISSKMISYKSLQGECYICYVNIKSDDCEYKMFGLVDDVINKYVFIGTDSYHPFLCTNVINQMAQPIYIHQF